MTYFRKGFALMQPLLLLSDIFRYFNIAIAVYLITVDTVMAFGVIVVGGLCFIGIVGFLKKRISYLGKRARIADSNTSKCALHTISGIKDVFVFIILSKNYSFL